MAAKVLVVWSCTSGVKAVCAGLVVRRVRRKRPGVRDHGPERRVYRPGANDLSFVLTATGVGIRTTPTAVSEVFAKKV